MSFPSTCGIFSKIDFILGHKTNTSKFTKIEDLCAVFLYHSSIKVEMRDSDLEHSLYV